MAYEIPSDKCRCRCHLGGSPPRISEETKEDEGVDFMDIIGAVTACPSCAFLHIVPFIDKHAPPPVDDGN